MKRALLIGSPYKGLAGSLTDVERVAGLLTPRRFEIRKLVGDDEATRANILGAYRTLINDTADGDVIVVYYSGHGARSLDEEYVPPSGDAPPKRYHHFIVPMDLGESSDSDFRGILSLELSSLLAQLTKRTRNVTVIFDSCHSAGMTRDLRLRPKGLPKEWFIGAHSHFQKFVSGEVPGFPLENVAVEGNPYAVRLMAALPSQMAWEYETSDGTSYGLMTDSLLKAFEEVGDRPVTWDAVTRRVRELVRQQEPGQYPEVEGPSSRFLFDLKEAQLTGVVHVEMTEDGLRLLGGRLHGIEVGDKYVVMPPGFEEVDSAHALARATVTYVSGAWSLLTGESGPGPLKLPAGSVAFPVSREYHRKPVVIKAGTKMQQALADAISKSELIRLPCADALALVEEHDGFVSIKEQDDRDLITALKVTDDTANTVVENLDRLARARRLEALDSGTGRNKLSAEFKLDWGRVVGGVPDPQPLGGALVFVGDRIFVRVRNNSQAVLYVSVFDIGLAGKITLLTGNRAPDGVELQRDGEPFMLGYQEGIGWKGLNPLTWPEDVPKDGRPRPESLVVIVTDHPQNLRSLESPGMAAPKGAEALRSELQRIVDQIATGRTRDASPDNPPPEVRYAVKHINFMVDPTDATVHSEPVMSVRGSKVGKDVGSIVPAGAVPDLGTFLIDERPNLSAVYRHARGPAAPSVVAVQLGEIIVHSNRALFSTDVRVDALVITGGNSAEGVYRADTAKFQGINDGDRLPLDNLLVYHGLVSGFVDLAVWVSRDNDRSLSLADMLKEYLGTAEFKEAALVLAGIAVSAPAAGAIVAGLGAATTVTNIVYKLLSAAVGKSIGLYRTSLLSNEGFGVGRHPLNGTMRAQDFSFWYQVSEVE